jgi:hypothetical protein
MVGGPTMSPNVTRVYLRSGRVAHLLDESSSPNVGTDEALCGIWAGFGSAVWLGTGTQDEHERAAELPLCSRCEVRAC